MVPLGATVVEGTLSGPDEKQIRVSIRFDDNVLKNATLDYSPVTVRSVFGGLGLALTREDGVEGVLYDVRNNCVEILESRLRFGSMLGSKPYLQVQHFERSTYTDSGGANLFRPNDDTLETEVISTIPPYHRTNNDFSTTRGQGVFGSRGRAISILLRPGSNLPYGVGQIAEIRIDLKSVGPKKWQVKMVTSRSCYNIDLEKTYQTTATGFVRTR